MSTTILHQMRLASVYPIRRHVPRGEVGPQMRDERPRSELGVGHELRMHDLPLVDLYLDSVADTELEDVRVIELVLEIAVL